MVFNKQGWWIGQANGGGRRKTWGTETGGPAGRCRWSKVTLLSDDAGEAKPKRDCSMLDWTLQDGRGCRVKKREGKL